MKKSIIFLFAIVISTVGFSQESFRRWRKMNQIRLDKFDLILPEVMRENQIDMWIIMCREGNFDPMYFELGEGYVGHNGYYIFTDTGKPRIERAVLGIDGYLLEETKAYDYFGSESELKEFVTKRDPKRIGLNMSKDIGGADGLSFTGRKELGDILGAKYESRFVSAEKLFSDFRSRHVASEIAIFGEAGDYSYQIAERALSNEIITPGVTTLAEVAWWMKEQLFKNNLQSSFGMPSIYITGPNGIEATSNDRIIQRGDILMLDWGVGLMHMYTDMKRMAYVLKEGEKEVPASIQKAFDEAVKVRTIVTSTIKPGITAKQNEDNVYRALQAGGYSKIDFNKPNADSKTDVIIGCHSVGDWGHGTGPSIAFFNPVQLNYV
ncbi:MAG: M24 family metallopeptidase, partial [Cytophagales bacterium]